MLTNYLNRYPGKLSNSDVIRVAITVYHCPSYRCTLLRGW